MKNLTVKGILGHELDPARLDLNQLTLPEIDLSPYEKSYEERLADTEAALNPYMEKYSTFSEAAEHYLNDASGADVDVDLLEANIGIFKGNRERGMLAAPGIVKKFMERLEKREHEVYGDRFEELKYHRTNDPIVNHLLIEDAVKTGKWKELPYCLQGEYHKRVDCL